MKTQDILVNQFNISQKTLNFVENIRQQIQPRLDERDKLAEIHQYRVIAAMQHAGLSDRHFAGTTGYGYNDAGREAIEQIYAELFGAEAALVRPHITCGTHAISLCLFGVLRPGDELLAISGAPYDTIVSVIGADGREKNEGTLTDFGVTYQQVDLTPDGKFDEPRILASITSKTKMIYIQRSTGYAWRKALTMEAIADITAKVKAAKPDVVVFVDNCYGELLDEYEPTAVGADLVAGSLIKNIGGGIAPSGGYVAGKSTWVARCAARLSAPGIAGETGATIGINRLFFQGLFLAPKVTAEALKSAILVGAAYQALGFDVCPLPEDYRSDIIQSVKLGSPDAVKIFCRAVQEAAPVDAFVTPEPWDMPGYADPVIMAAGAFIQGSSIELSADAPMRKPYIVYFQGGLTHAHGKLGLLLTLERLSEAGIITLP
ncbi:MAG: methionine gamma-lyase family protein [Eubacteriaceae bacterium]|nr:methionine gamma-lyase family protein [Eubacteriaceae bacterium]